MEDTIQHLKQTVKSMTTDELVSKSEAFELQMTAGDNTVEMLTAYDLVMMELVDRDYFTPTY